MIDTEAMQNGGLNVSDMHWSIDHIKTEFISGPDRNSRSNAAAGQPHRERLRMMIAT
jgi:hypothetical protein